jgi:hypothetical protein
MIMITDPQDDISQLGIKTFSEDEILPCPICGEPNDVRGTAHRYCEEADRNIEIVKAHQEAFNKLPADVILTLNIMVASYYEGLADKKEVGDNVSFWIYTVREAMNEKHKEMHS